MSWPLFAILPDHHCYSPGECIQGLPVRPYPLALFVLKNRTLGPVVSASSDVLGKWRKQWSFHRNLERLARLAIPQTLYRVRSFDLGMRRMD